jgi:hypothetical protein
MPLESTAQSEMTLQRGMMRGSAFNAIAMGATSSTSLGRHAGLRCAHLPELGYDQQPSTAAHLDGFSNG